MTRSIESLDPSTRNSLAKLAMQGALASHQNADPQQARIYAEQAAQLAPDLEDPWLILAAVSSPSHSIGYLENALRINPGSPRAKKGLEWARSRLKAEGSSISQAPIASQKKAAQATVYRIQPERFAPQKSPAVLRLAYSMLFFSVLFIAAAFTPYYYQYLTSNGSQHIARIQQFASSVQGLNPFHTGVAFTIHQTQSLSTPVIFETIPPPASAGLPIPTETPFLVPTATSTSPNTPTSLPTETQAPTNTPYPVETTEAPPVPSLTATAIIPQATSRPKQKASAGPGPRPVKVTLNDRWVDVDLSSQTTYAMQGDQIVRSFIVSTGRWPTVTITGLFKIYVKYVRASMSGDDYYLPNVPYVMYFYEDYGLHGTYWHNDFGTPMSHGCVNLKKEDAAWLYDFTSVGTFVSIHH